jgi:hypothetical protein
MSNDGIFVVAMLIVAGGWWIPLAIWGRRRARHWHQFDVAHEAAFLEENLREHERRAARLGPRPGGSSDWRTNEALAAYLRDYQWTFEDCPCPGCVSMWLMCKMADSPNPRHQELAKHMTKTVGVLLVGVGLALGGCAHYWTKPGSTALDFKQDYYQCYQEARSWGASGGLMIAAASEASRNRKLCLEAHGWEMDGIHMGDRGLWKATVKP